MSHFTASNGRTTALAVAVMMAITSALFVAGCDDFLQPEPKSLLSPENVLTEKAGLEGLLVDLNKRLRWEYFGFVQPLLTEYYFTDVALDSRQDASKFVHDMTTQITPTGDNFAKTREYWNHGYETISAANQLIGNVDNVTDWSGEEEKNAMLAAGYFHRAYWYYRLVHQFGDVPVYLDAINKPRLNFNTFSREAVLKKMRDDMEFAVQHLPRDVRPGEVNRAAGYHLLTKIYLSLRQFQDAVDAASQVINGSKHELMRNRFGEGAYAGDPKYNVLWDLHQKENKSLAENTEGLLVVQDEFQKEGGTGNNWDSGSLWIWVATPAWRWPTVRDPNGMHATTAGPEGNPFSDSLGRGDGWLRTSPYFNYKMWDGSGDLRHGEVNWFSLDDYHYNVKESEYYREPFVREFVGDTTRTWYPFMYNKLYVSGEFREHQKYGAHSDWYVFRLAGLYLLRAEAYYWMGQNSQAAADVNEVRARAEAQPVSAREVDIGYIFDERARELYIETPRKTELTRAAYIMAQLGRDGYSLGSMSQDNWYYDRIMDTNVYYRENIQFGANEYRIEPHHVYWPVPQEEIDTNVEGHINQTPGYTGSESNQEPLGYEAIQELADDSDDDASD